MPTTGIKAATQIAIGVETTAGTEVARTRRLMTRSASYREFEEHETFEQHMHGVLSRTLTAPVITRAGCELQIDFDLDFEQILLPLLAGVKGDVTPTSPGSGDAKLWTFTPSPTSVVDPKTYSLEWVEQNFASTPDTQPREALYGFCTGFELTANDNGVGRLSVQMVARKAAAGTKTTIALPTLTRAPNARWTCDIDDTWAGLGTTNIAGQVYGFSYKFGGFLERGYYLDGRSDTDFSTHEFMGGRQAELTLDVVHNPASGKLVPAEIAKKASQSLRFVQLQLTGAAFGAPDAAFNRQITLDGAYYHAPDSLSERGSDRNGHLITRLHLLSAYDPTGAADLRFLIQNALTAFP